MDEAEDAGPPGKSDPRVPADQVDAFRLVVTETLAANQRRSEGFERRATTLLSVLTGTLAFLLAVVGVAVAKTSLSWWVVALASLSIFALIGSAISSALVLHPLDVRVVGAERLEKMWADQKARPNSSAVQVLANVINDIVVPSAEGDNKGKPPTSPLASSFSEASSRATRLRQAIWLLVAGLCGLGATAVAVLCGRM